MVVEPVGSVRRPMRYPRGSTEVGAAFMRLRDLVAQSSKSGRVIAGDVGVSPAVLTKVLRPHQYQARRDWAQVQAILAAVDADAAEFTRVHGYVWGVELLDDHTTSPAPSPPAPSPPEPPAPLEGGDLDDEVRAAPAYRPVPVIPESPRWRADRDDEPTRPLGVGAGVAVRPPPPPLPEPRVGGSRGGGWSARSGPGWLYRHRAGAAVLGVFGAVAVALVVGVAVFGFGSGGSVTASPPQAGPVAPQGVPDAPVVPRPAALLARPEVAATVSLGGPLAGFAAVSPDGRSTYVTRRAGGTITEIDTATNQVRAVIGVPAGPPQSLAISPDGDRLYVSVYDEAGSVAALSVLDTTTRQQVAVVPLRTRPFVSAITPDGASLWVPNHDTGSITVVDLATDTVRIEFRVSPNPHWVAFSRDGTRAYAANHESNRVDVIDTTSFAVLTSIPVGTSPHSIALQPRGPLLAVAAYDTDGVDLIDTSIARPIATVRVGRNPNVVRWSVDGKLLYVSVEGENRIAVIDPATRLVVGEVPVGRTPSSIALTPDGERAYVTNLDDGSVSLLRLAR